MATALEMAREIELPLPSNTSDSEAKEAFSSHQPVEEMYRSYIELWKNKHGNEKALWQAWGEPSQKRTDESKRAIIEELQFLKQLQFYNQIADISSEFADLLFQKTKKTFIVSKTEFEFEWPLKATHGKTAERVEELVELLKILKILANPEDQQEMTNRIVEFIKRSFDGVQNNTRDQNIIACLMTHVARPVSQKQQEEQAKEKKEEKSQWEVLLGEQQKRLALLLTHEGIPATIRPLTEEELLSFAHFSEMPSDRMITFLKRLGIPADNIPFIKETLRRIKQKLFFATIQQIDPTIASKLFAAETDGPTMVLKRSIRSTKANTARHIRQLAKMLQMSPNPDVIIPFISSRFVFVQNGIQKALTDAEINELRRLISLRGLEKIFTQIALFKSTIEDSLLRLKESKAGEEKRNDTHTYLEVSQTYLNILHYEKALEHAQSIFNAMEFNTHEEAKAFATQLQSLSESKIEEPFVSHSLSILRSCGYLLTFNPQQGSPHTLYHVDAKELKTKDGIPLTELCAIFRDSTKSEKQRLKALGEKGIGVEGGHPFVHCIDKKGRKVFFKFNKRGLDDALTSPLEAAISQVYRDDLGNQASEVRAVYDSQGSVGVLSVGIPGFHDFVELQKVLDLVSELEGASALKEQTLIEQLTLLLQDEKKKDVASKALDLFSTGQMTIQEFKDVMTAKGQARIGLAGPAVVSHVNQEDDNHLGNGGIAYLRNEKGELIDRNGQVIPLDQNGKPARKPVYVFARIDFDMSFWQVLVSTGVQTRTEALWERPTFPLDKANLILFPQVHDSGWYGYSRYHDILVHWRGAEKRHKESGGMGTTDYMALQNDPAFIHDKWSAFLRLALKPPQLFDDALLKHLNADHPQLLAITNKISALAKKRRQQLEDQLTILPEFWKFMEQDAHEDELKDTVETLRNRGVPEKYLQECTSTYNRIKEKCRREKSLAAITTKKFVRRLPENNPILNVFKEKLRQGRTPWFLKKEMTVNEMDSLVAQIVQLPKTTVLHKILWKAGIYLTLKNARIFKQELLLSLIKNNELNQLLKARKAFLKNKGFIYTGRFSTQSIIENDLNPALKEGPIVIHTALQKLGITIPISELEQCPTLAKEPLSHTNKTLEAFDIPDITPRESSYAESKKMTISELMDSLDLIFEPQGQTNRAHSGGTSPTHPSPMEMMEWNLFEKIENKANQKVILTVNQKVQIEIPFQSPQPLEEGEEGEVTITPTIPTSKKPRRLVYEYEKNQSGIRIPDSNGDIIYRAVLALRKLHYDKTGNKLVSLILDETVLTDKKWKTAQGRASILKQIEMAGINRENIIMPKYPSILHDREATKGKSKGV